eukprot:TRINITY_DN518_c0_g1_i12.p2 TRINITY_DN518_c0_g1~~TRINITY_DN518_c0_g1_i12.p2  ORF type:complete len:104 (+),score=24.05 TRINITY_DN518_c0_g1_i12:129-440(+)
MFRVGVQMNAVNLTAMYKKAMRLSTESRSKTSMGEMSNMMASDSAILFNFIHFSNQVWVAPIQIILALVLLFISMSSPFSLSLYSTLPFFVCVSVLVVFLLLI